MATLKTIRKRITSVKNTQKITKAMKMVAAARLRRAQMAVISARPYAQGLLDIVTSIIKRSDEITNPLLIEKAEPKKIKFLVFTSNRGLCGGFNSNLLRKLEDFLATHINDYQEVDIEMIGKKGRDYYHSRERDLENIYIDYADSMNFDQASELAGQMIEQVTSGQYDICYIVYNRFKSALTQIVEIEALLPFQVKDDAHHYSDEELVDYIYEPQKEELLNAILPKVLATQIYRAHLESVASELGSRMTAMESATKNAQEMIGKLRLQYNRLRQAAITKELMDIVNGAESIK